ncbi:hypothetical protein Taro_036025 [Colocasia esculenta]|uniref:Uncharacterized protein n=1 Tax=Colocasia esculenta TaxID=4460 RepID=A0A843WKF3_COLES|nr:hypothetical protein [Colocasia esculenta]
MEESEFTLEVPLPSIFREGSVCGSSNSGGDDDLRELVHTASSHSPSGASPADGRTVVVPRSQSADMARIDEDGPCDFGGDADRIARFSSGGSSSGGDDDLRELVRAASSHSTSGALPAGGQTAVVSRIQSAGMATIDEDGTCDFGGDAGRFARSGSGGSNSDDDLRELVHAAFSHSSPGTSPAGGRTAVVSRS